MAGMHQYEVVGRMKPNEKHPHTEVYRMRVFSPNKVVARSRFWYFISQLKRVKRANGEILSTSEIFEKNPNVVNNYGFWIRYNSRSGTHNMYKEYRATTVTTAVEKMYAQMSSLHRARQSAIQIIKTDIVDAADCKRPYTQQFHDSKIKFQLRHRVPRPSHKRFVQTFKAVRPSTFF